MDISKTKVRTLLGMVEDISKSSSIRRSTKSQLRARLLISDIVQQASGEDNSISSVFDNAKEGLSDERVALLLEPREQRKSPLTLLEVALYTTGQVPFSHAIKYFGKGRLPTEHDGLMLLYPVFEFAALPNKVKQVEKIAYQYAAWRNSPNYDPDYRVDVTRSKIGEISAIVDADEFNPRIAIPDFYKTYRTKWVKPGEVAQDVVAGRLVQAKETEIVFAYAKGLVDPATALQRLRASPSQLENSLISLYHEGVQNKR